MNEQQIEAVVNDVLGRRFPGAAFKGADVALEADFDGESIIRVVAHFDSRPAEPDDLVRSVHDLRTALIEKGEERFVFLTNDIAAERSSEPDQD